MLNELAMHGTCKWTCFGEGVQNAPLHSIDTMPICYVLYSIYIYTYVQLNVFQTGTQRLAEHWKTANQPASQKERASDFLSCLHRRLCHCHCRCRCRCCCHCRRRRRRRRLSLPKPGASVRQTPIGCSSVQLSSGFQARRNSGPN